FGVTDAKVGLVGAAVSDHPEIDSICSQLSKLGIRISVSSLRADAITDRIADTLVSSGHKTVSLAPEAGSERLRKVIKKDLREDDILRAAEIIFSKGIPNLKLYFMIGLPTETIEDIDSIVTLTKKVHDIQLSAGRIKGSIGRITLSVNCFVPKPFTPFQWCSMNSIEDLKVKLKYLKKSISGIRNTNMIHDLPKWAHLQGMLSRGDRRLSGVLERMIKIDDWRKDASDTGIDPSFYTMRERYMDEVFPWEIIDIGVKREYLWKEYQKAMYNIT
ncbi:MAG: radical SAM protein, partial [Nitrospirota bacterium]